MLKLFKLLLGICFLIILMLALLSILSSNSSNTSTLESIVSQTHHQLSQLHKLKEEFEDQPLDNTLLAELGFVESPIIYPEHSWSNISIPVIVTAVSSEDLGFLPDFVITVQKISPSGSLVIYTLDLSEIELKLVSDQCNGSCFTLPFEFRTFSSHVRDLKVGAFRPIVIQEMLQRVGLVLWLDPCMRLEQSLSSVDTLELWKTSFSKGSSDVITWSLLTPAPHLPTSALTHPGMFSAMRTEKWKYDFQKMADPKAVFLLNSERIHYKFIRPWVSCALTSSCLSPIGAQDSGCNYNKKPLFRYSGCHMYDISAFNVALGLAFGANDESYLEPGSKFSCAISSSRDLRVPFTPYTYNRSTSAV